METKYLEFETCGQVLIRTDNITVVAGAANLYAARFTFTPEWDGEVKTAQFKLADGTTYDAAITDDICDVPWEAIQKPGTVIVGVFAGNLITTDAAKLEVYESSFDPEDAPVNEPSPGALPAAILKAHEYMTTAGEYADDAAQSAAAAKVSEDNAAESEDAASEKAETAAEEAKNAGDSADDAAQSAAEALNYANAANASKTEAAQALSDLLAMMGVDIATLTNGKLTPSQIPDLSINDVFLVSNTDEMLALNAQRGDCALIMADDEVVSDSYILSADDPTVLANWKKLGVSYVSNAGHAETADYAENANKINNHRLVVFESVEEMNSAVKVDGTIYFAPYEVE